MELAAAWPDIPRHRYRLWSRTARACPCEVWGWWASISRSVLKVVNGVPILRAFRETSQEERDGVVISISNTLTMDPPRMTQRISVSGPGGGEEYERRQRLYRAEELGTALEHAGLTIVGIFARPDGATFEPAVSSTIWIVGQRSFPEERC